MKKFTDSSRCPQILYKFTRFKTFFENQELRVTPICDLNDPFEGVPVIEHVWKEDDFVNDYKNKLYKIKNQSFVKEYGFDRMYKEAEINPKYVYKMLKNIIAKSRISSIIHNILVSDKISVLSLTSCNNNELMWAFYADTHKGFAVGLKSDHEIFSAHFWDDEKLNVKLRKIEYVSKRKNFYLEDGNGDFINTLLYKSKSWKHEKEWRLIISNTEKLHTRNGVSGFIFIPDDAIAEIILGYQAEKILMEKAKQFCEKRNILLRKAVFNKTQYKIDIVDL